MPFHSLLSRLPLSRGQKVFVGVSFISVLCALPVALRSDKKGEDLFSQQKPQWVEDKEDKIRAAR